MALPGLGWTGSMDRARKRCCTSCTLSSGQRSVGPLGQNAAQAGVESRSGHVSRGTRTVYRFQIHNRCADTARSCAATEEGGGRKDRETAGSGAKPCSADIHDECKLAGLFRRKDERIAKRGKKQWIPPIQIQSWWRLGAR